MEELSWCVCARIARDRHGNVHWFVESSDGLSHGHLVDEGSPATVMSAVLSCRREAFMELLRLEADLARRERHLPPGTVSGHPVTHRGVL